MILHHRLKALSSFSQAGRRSQVLSYNASSKIQRWSIRFQHINPALSDVKGLVLVAPHGLCILDHNRMRFKFKSPSKKCNFRRAGCNRGKCNAIDIQVSGTTALNDPYKAATQCPLKLLRAGAKFDSFDAKTYGRSTSAYVATLGKFTNAFAHDWHSEVG